MNLFRFTIKDSQDQESKILGMATIGWLVMTAKFIVGGWEIYGLGVQPLIGAGEYGGATAALLAVVAYRKWAKMNAEAKIKTAKVEAIGKGADLSDVEKASSPLKEERMV